MPNPKAQRVTNPNVSSADFLGAGPTPNPVMQPESGFETPGPVVAGMPPSTVSEEPGKKQEINALVPPTSPPIVPAVAAIAPATDPDSFILIQTRGKSQLKAWHIEGVGVVLKSNYLITGQPPNEVWGQSLCFVSGSKLENGQLVKA